jgi:hypothetical protein
MMDWQSKSYPVCNSIHELGILGGSAFVISHSGIDYIGRGSWRSTHSIRNHHADEKTPATSPTNSLITMELNTTKKVFN